MNESTNLIFAKALMGISLELRKDEADTEIWLTCLDKIGAEIDEYLDTEFELNESRKQVLKRNIDFYYQNARKEQALSEAGKKRQRTEMDATKEEIPNKTLSAAKPQLERSKTLVGSGSTSIFNGSSEELS